MSEHTPGPWKALDTTKSTFGMGSVVAAMGQTTDGLHWCVVAVGERVRDEELEANARLMAAAPKLLEALKEVVRISDRKHDAWDAAKAAIAKAEGRMPFGDERVPWMRTLTLREVATGQTVTIPLDDDPDVAWEFLWEEGNYSCDCNRHLFFRRALGEDPDLGSHECGDERYEIVDAPWRET